MKLARLKDKISTNTPKRIMKNNTESFIKAYHDFRDAVDLRKGGILPELDKLVTSMLLGVPPVPADGDQAPDAPIIAIDQKITILKAIFVEVNQGQTDDFLDQGLARYDQAGKLAKILLEETSLEPESD